MQPARFIIFETNIERLAGRVEAAMAETGRNLFLRRSDDDAPTLIDLLTRDARARVHDAMDSPDEIAASAETAEGRQKILAAAALYNPYRWYAHTQKNGFELEAIVPQDVVLPFEGDPAEIGLDAEPVLHVRIGFAGNGAPAQQHRAPGIDGGATFQARSAALARMAATEVPGGPGPGKFKRKFRVHVFVVDQGMHPGYVNALGGNGTYASALSSGGPPALGALPTEQRHRRLGWPRWHAHMIARNVLAVANGNHGNPPPGSPGATEEPILFHDVPALPDRVASVIGTAADLALQVGAVAAKIATFGPTERAVIVNAWGVKDRLLEAPLGALTETAGHSLNVHLAALAGNRRVAVVFAAGNAGLFTPDPEAGPYDRGPRRSIWYPAALPGVLTAGAADATGKWIGASSQGPFAGATAPAPVLPQFSVPSYFREDHDAHIANTGSSASCALLAGVVAARWRDNQSDLKRPLAQAAAKKYGHTGKSNRLGHGMIQAWKV